ncbi:MAG: hypothetical protein PHS06_05285 [Candidatus Shapirobacteria bacterium]|nr:hypothetical protein [Candidatus Shapirobacteria bacterium]
MDFNFSDFYVSIPSDLLWGILALILGFFLITSFVLHYHWRNYTVKKKIGILPKIIFWGVSLILIFSMFLTLIIYEINL